MPFHEIQLWNWLGFHKICFPCKESYLHTLNYVMNPVSNVRKNPILNCYVKVNIH